MVFCKSWRMGSKKPVFVSISLDFFIKYNTALLIPCAAFHNWTGSIFACVILWFQTFVSGFVHCVLALSSMFSSFPFSVFQSSPHKADMLSGISSSLSFSLTSYKLPSPFASPPPNNARSMWQNGCVKMYYTFVSIAF